MMDSRFLDILAERVIIGDGAMGTRLYSHGVFLNACFDELNLTRRDLIGKIHREYIDAGSDFIETNTFGANRHKLALYGLGEMVREINAAGAVIAREAAGEDILVAGAMGPLRSSRLNPIKNLALQDITAIYSEQAEVLAGNGVDFILLETFPDIAHLLTAVDAVAAVTDLPIVAQLTVGSLGSRIRIQDSQLLDEETLRTAAVRLSDHPRVAAVGINCSVGPAAMLACIQAISPVTDKPISVQPNAGLPKHVDGRTIYMSTPEYLAEYAKRFYENGARIIGGCCGTTPEHIREISRAVRSMDKAVSRRPAVGAAVVRVEEMPEARDPVPLADRSDLGKKLAAGDRIRMVELTPPRGGSLKAMIRKAKTLRENGIDAVNIPDGPRASSRMSPLATAMKIQAETGLETVVHICCRDRNLIGLQADILGAPVMGIQNLLIITGDPPKLGDYPDATAVFDLDSVALTALVNGLNRGVDFAGNPMPNQLALTLGVGANPVSADMDRELSRYRDKAAAGAEYAITQPVFDSASLFRFLDGIESAEIPVIAGIWPFTSYKNAEFMANEVPGVVVPEPLLARMKATGSREEARRTGIEIARELMAEISHRVAGYAVSAPFGNIKIAMAAHGLISIEEAVS